MEQADSPGPARPGSLSAAEVGLVWWAPLLVCSSLASMLLAGSGFFTWFYGPDELPGAFDPGSVTHKLALHRQGLWVSALATPLQVAVVLLVLRQGMGVPPAEVGLTTRNVWRNVLAGLAFAFIFVPGALGLNVLATYALGLAGSEPQDHPFTQLGQVPLHPVEWGLLIFGAVVAAPVSEELVYRGVIQPWVMARPHRRGLAALGVAGAFALYAALEPGVLSLPVTRLAVKLAPVWALVPLVGVFWLISRHSAAWAGLFATAVAFAWVHVQAWPSPVPLLWFALGLGWLAWRGRSIAGAMVLHASLNAVSCAVLLSPTLPERLPPPEPPGPTQPQAESSP